MKVLKSINITEDGNECYIYKNISLVKIFDFYVVAISQRVIGSWVDDKISLKLEENSINQNLEQATEYYENLTSNILKKFI